MMPGDDDILFGNLPPGYAAMPPSRHIQDLRQAPRDYAGVMQDAYGYDTGPYPASRLGGAAGGTQGFLPANMTTQDLAFADDETGAYSPSFKPNFRPSRPRQAPYQPSDYGPNLPHPYDPMWLQGIVPGSPGWRTPPSPSGPHPHGAQPEGQGTQPPIYQNNGTPITAIAPHVAALLRLLGYR